jgi:hypothetical protein
MGSAAGSRAGRVFPDKTCSICNTTVKLNNYRKHRARCELYGGPVDRRRKEFRNGVPAAPSPGSAAAMTSALVVGGAIDRRGKWMAAPDKDRMLAFWEEGGHFQTDMGVSGGIAELVCFLLQEECAKKAAAPLAAGDGLQVKTKDGAWTFVQSETIFFTILVNKAIDLILDVDERSDRQLIFSLTYQGVLNDRSKLFSESLNDTIKTRLQLYIPAQGANENAAKEGVTLEQLIAEGRLDDEQLRKVKAVRRLSRFN